MITGRGLHSAGPPVLRGEIEYLLARLEGTLVSSFNAESGGGAFLVELHRAAPPARRPASSPRNDASLDPVLRREAEEALVDLGIAPTEPLVEAEMRRIVRERERGAG